MPNGDIVPYLIQNSDEYNPTIHTLRLGLNTIGRELNNSIVISDKSLSRHHAEFEVTDSGVILTDLDSLNHTFVQEQQIKRQELKDGDQIRFGGLICQFVQTIANQRCQLAINPEKNWSVLTRISPESSRLNLKSLLEETRDKPQGTILKLRHKTIEERAVNKLKILLEFSQELASPQTSAKLLNKILDLLFQIIEEIEELS